MVKLKFLGKDAFAYKFLLQDANYGFVNAIRRGIMGHTKTMAIEKVMIYKNDSVMSDEFLAHRLGLVPVEVEDFEDETEVSMLLSAKGGEVFSGDIDDRGQANINMKNIPIVKLNSGKEIEAELVLKPGTGSDHIKWTPALVYYNNVPNIVQKSAKITEKEAIAICPKEFLEVRAGKLVLKDPYNCDVCKFCERHSDGKVEMDLKEDEFVLSIEPFGNLSIQNIIKGVKSYLTEELDSLEKELKVAK